MDTNSMDTNIDNYSTDDLITILNLEEEPTEQDIIGSTNQLIDKYTDENNDDLANFFIDVQNTLMSDLFPDADDADQPTREAWYKNEQAPQPNQEQADKTTDRKQQVGFFNTPNSSVMNRQQLGVSNDYQVPVAQGTINPNLKNTTTRTVMVNSAYRQTILPYTDNPNGPSSASNFTCNLTDTLNNVIDMKLYSVQLPMSWYVIDATTSTDCFLIEYDALEIPIKVESGNYTIEALVKEIQDQINAAAVAHPELTGLIFDHNATNGKTYFTYASGQEFKIIFYDELRNICPIEPSKTCSYIRPMMRNNNLGWYLGFRSESYVLDKPDTPDNPDTSGTPITLYSEAVYDLYGTKNVYIVLDDYNQNRLNKGLVSISETESSISMPSYFSNDLNCSLKNDPDQPVQYIPDAPRRITQAQLYTLNEIIRNRDNTNKTRNTAPTTTDIFAVIPIERTSDGRSFGTQIIEFGGSLSQNQRTYFGPVNIDRLGIRLVDDKGNTLNLNGNDWSFSITVDSLYQY